MNHWFLIFWTITFLSLNCLETSANQTSKEEIIISEQAEKLLSPYTIFDDKMLLDGYSEKYNTLSKGILIAMIKDDTLSSYKIAAAVRTFNKNFSQEIVSKEKKRVIKTLLRRLNKTDSPFVQTEIMYALCRIDRYQYFKSMVPALIQKLNHYNSTVNDIAFYALDDLIASGNNRSREARVVFNTFRKVFFLSRRRLIKIDEPGPKLTKKLKLLRWSIKVLGNQELKKLPNEVINLL